MKNLIYIEHPDICSFVVGGQVIRFSTRDHQFIIECGPGSYIIYHSNNESTEVVFIDKENLINLTCKTSDKSTFVRINERSKIKRSKIILVDRNNRLTSYSEPYEIIINSEYHFYFKDEKERDIVYEEMTK